MVSLMFTLDRALLLWQRKFEKFNTKSDIIRRVRQLHRTFLHQGGFPGSANLTMSLKFTPDRPLLAW